jgi:hypothetical protein
MVFSSDGSVPGATAGMAPEGLVPNSAMRRADLSMDGVNLVQNRRGLTMEAQDMDLAVDAFRDGDNRLVECAAGEEQFFADAS